jgi:hypothetical protein
VLYPLIDANGVYICEDTRTSYWSHYGAGYRKPDSFIEYAKGLVDRLHAWYIEDEAIARDETFARMTLGIFFYDSMVVFEKRTKSVPFQCSVGRIGVPQKLGVGGSGESKGPQFYLRKALRKLLRKCRELTSFR